MSDHLERVKFSGLCTLFPKQREFFGKAASHRYTLYGGSRGPGKSYALRWLAVWLLLRWARQGHRHVRVGLFCETYPDLNERQISKVKVEFPPWLGTYQEAAREFRLHEDYGSGVIAFRNLDDPAKYRSAEFAAMLVDELTMNPVQVFNTLRGSLRWPGIEHTPFAAASNPGGIGHQWVRDYFIDRNLPPELRDRADQFAFVRALPSDNPHLPPAYFKELEAQPEPLRRAWLLGDWDAVAGAALELDLGVHLVPAFEPPAHWTRFGGFDWGFQHPWVFIACVADETGNVYVLDTLSGRRMQDDEIAEAICRRFNVAQFNLPVAAGHDCFNEVQAHGGYAETVEERFAKHRIVLMRANIHRVTGLNILRGYLAHGDGRPPALRFIDTPENRRTIAQLRAMILNPDNLEDVLKQDASGDTGEGGDDRYDCLRYALASRPPQAPVIVEPEYVDPWSPETLRYEYERTHRVTRDPPDDPYAGFEFPDGLL
jgi:hypothetical protein